MQSPFQVIEGNGADLLQAFGAELVERVVGGMPGVVLEIDEIERGDAALDERNVVVENGAAEEGEMLAQAEHFGGGKDALCKVGRGVWRQRDGEILVAD